MDRSIEYLQERLRLGDNGAFEEIYKRYQGKIYGFCINNGQSKSDAEEVLQDVFFKLWIKRKKLTSGGNLQAYLFTLARNVIIDKYRQLMKRKAMVDYQIHFLEPENETENAVLFNELNAEIQKTLNSLPQLCKLVFQMSRLKGYSNREIAEELNISIKTVENHISRALRVFREKFGKNIAVFLLLSMGITL